MLRLRFIRQCSVYRSDAWAKFDSLAPSPPRKQPTPTMSVSELLKNWPSEDRAALLARVLAAPQLPEELRDPTSETLNAVLFRTVITRPGATITLSDVLSWMVNLGFPVGAIPDAEAAIHSAMLGLSQ